MENAFSLISNTELQRECTMRGTGVKWGEMRRDWVQDSSPSYRGNQDGRKAEEFASKH